MSLTPPGPRASSRLRRLAFFLLFALAIEYLVVPQIAGARKTLLPAQRPPFNKIVRIGLSSLAVSHVVPGGGAAGSGVAVDLLKDAGVAPADAGFALATQGLGSAVVLNALLWLGLVVSIPLQGFDPLYGTAALLGALVLGAFAALVLLLTRGEARATELLSRVAARVPFLDEAVMHRLLHHVAGRLRDLAGDRALLARAIGWAGANWLLDAVGLWLCLAAFGAPVRPDSLLVAYGLANVVAAIPVTPGGLGVMEAVLTAALVGFGSSRGVAILGVVTWRLFSFWLPIPVGAAAYLSLKIGSRHDRTAIVTELRRVAERAAHDAESARTWAARHGVHAPASRRQ